MPTQTLTKQNTSFRLSRKSIAKIIITIFIISLIPLIAISFFNRQSADDFQYGNLAAHAWRNTGSFYQVILAAFLQVQSSYIIWQGTFSAVFLFALQPAVFSEQLYFLTTIIIIFSLIGSTLYFLYVIFVRYINADRWTWIIISLICLLFCIQYAPSASDAFYWFNGGIYYTFFYSLFLILNGMVLSIPFYKSKKTVTFYTFVICFLSFFIGGGNFTTALVACVTMLGFCILCFIKKAKYRQVIYLSFFLLLLGLIISAIAPGNAFRSQALIAGGTYPTSFIKTIIDSFAHALRLITDWTNVFFLSILIVLTPLMWVNAKRCRFSFKYPILVVIGSYCLFSAQLAPPLFAMSYIGESRQVNIYYFMYILLTMLNAFYCVGWLQKLYDSGKLGVKVTLTNLASFHSKLKQILIFTMFLIVLLNIGYCKHTPSIKAVNMIVKSEAQLFPKERDERLDIYNDDEIRDVTVMPLSKIPDLFHQVDLLFKDWWVNQSVAKFYDKHSVSLY